MPHTYAEGDPLQKVDTALLYEKRVVTYKWLSRLLKVDVNAAKRLLSEYHQQSKADSVYATFCVQGAVRSAEGYRCELVSQDNLEEVQSTYSTFSVHIYSLQPSKLKDPDLLFAIDLDVAKHDTPETMRSGNAVPAKGKASFFDGYAKKPPRKSVSDSKIPTPSRPQVAAKKSNNDSDAASSSAAAAAQKKLREEQQAALTKLMESDEDEEQSDGEDGRTLRKAAGKSTEGVDSHEPEEEEDEVAEEAAPAVAKETAEPEDEVIPVEIDANNDDLPTRRVKKRRRVRKTRHIAVGKYMKTEDYSDWEDYSEDEKDVPAPEPKRAKQDTVVAQESEEASSSTSTKKGAKAAGNKKGAGQKTLFSFFGKK
ncbi:DNA polymerase delta subunit 3 [Geranomyces michiganensis]|nr:DNA polymerase delta subunit 3 [Geranomyces michiganensis]